MRLPFISVIIGSKVIANAYEGHKGKKLYDGPLEEFSVKST